MQFGTRGKVGIKGKSTRKGNIVINPGKVVDREKIIRDQERQDNKERSYSKISATMQPKIPGQQTPKVIVSEKKNLCRIRSKRFQTMDRSFK